ncbi:MFS transporter [Salinisphaera sp. LB1]|uniref:MFS transporter n=1 Tax=Salinisphaera sp. LB1 TaxID=2183911 RepID=UPI000D7064C6|nr:MFS transporter [Salinisphaera sp. LB1]AWN14268.1 Transporter [Salinisphaera sp. LB1]
MATQGNVRTIGQWDRRYEIKAVIILALGFGLVGLDRWIIAPLFPAMAQDLGLGYEDLGLIIGVLGVAWGVFSTIAGAVSDRVGRRRILIPSLLCFSLLSCFSGLATGLVSLLFIRIVMGATEGAFCPASVAATGEASHPKRRGLNQGLQLSMFALLGLGLAPIIATQLLTVVPSWRWVFVISAIPGLILSVFAYFVIREPEHIRQAEPQNDSSRPRWSEILRSRNVLLGMSGMLCNMACIFVISAMVPNYLTDYLGLASTHMGFVLSALGIGGFFGEFMVPAASDHIGRRPTAILAFLIALVALWGFSQLGASPWLLFLLLLPVAFCCFGILALFTGPVATEAVQIGLVSSAIGIVSGAGEIFGGGIAPFVAGTIAAHFGIQDVLYLPMASLAVGVVISLFLRETAPRRVNHAAMAPMET